MGSKNGNKKAAAATQDAKKQNQSFRLGLELVALVVILAVAYKQLLTIKTNKSATTTTATPATPVVVATSGKIAGVEFPFLSNLNFMGGGTRTKYGIAQIYAAGLYVDGRAPAKWAAKLGDKADSSSALLNTIAQDTSHVKAIVLHFLRSVDADKVQESLQQELSKRLDESSTQAFLDKLHQVFPPDRVSKGTEITMTCAAGSGRLTFASAGQTAVLAGYKKACPALWDVYIGPQAVSKDIRSGFHKGVTGAMDIKSA